MHLGRTRSEVSCVMQGVSRFFLTLIYEIFLPLKTFDRSRMNELGRGSEGFGPYLGFEVCAAAICIAPFWVVTPSSLVGG